MSGLFSQNRNTATAVVIRDMPDRPEGLPLLNDLLTMDLDRLKMTKHELARKVALSPQAVSAWGTRGYIPSQHVDKVLAALSDLDDGAIARAAADGTLKLMENYELECNRIRSEADAAARAERSETLAKRMKQGIAALSKGAFQAEQAAYRFMTQDADAQKRLNKRRALSAKWDEIRTQDYASAYEMIVNDYTGYESHFNFDFYMMRLARSKNPSDAANTLAAAATARMNARTNDRLADVDNIYPYDHWYNNGEVVAELYEIEVVPSPRFKDSENTKPSAMVRRRDFEKPLLNLVAAQRQQVLHLIGKGLLYVINRSEAYDLDDADTKKVTSYINWLQRDYFNYFQNEVSIIVVPSVTAAIRHLMTAVLQLEAAAEEALGYEIEQNADFVDEWGDEFDEAQDRFNDEMFQQGKDDTGSKP